MSGELEKLILGDIDVEINPSESTEERDVYNCLKTGAEKVNRHLTESLV